MAGTAGAAATLCARVYAVDPREPGHYPPCPFRLLTSLDCPGCGISRGLYRALHGDLLGAADYNLCLVLALPLLIAAWVIGFAGLVGWSRPLPRIPSRSFLAIPVMIITFWVLRNLPVPVLSWLHS